VGGVGGVGSVGGVGGKSAFIHAVWDIPRPYPPHPPHPPHPLHPLPKYSLATKNEQCPTPLLPYSPIPLLPYYTQGFQEFLIRDSYRGEKTLSRSIIQDFLV